MNPGVCYKETWSIAQRAAGLFVGNPSGLPLVSFLAQPFHPSAFHFHHVPLPLWRGLEKRNITEHEQGASRRVETPLPKSFWRELTCMFSSIVAPVHLTAASLLFHPSSSTQEGCCRQASWSPQSSLIQPYLLCRPHTSLPDSTKVHQLIHRVSTQHHQHRCKVSLPSYRVLTHTRVLLRPTQRDDAPRS